MASRAPEAHPTVTNHQQPAIGIERSFNVWAFDVLKAKSFALFDPNSPFD
jgi:hypothetical protein